MRGSPTRAPGADATGMRCERCGSGAVAAEVHTVRGVPGVLCGYCASCGYLWPVPRVRLVPTTPRRTTDPSDPFTRVCETDGCDAVLEYGGRGMPARFCAACVTERRREQVRRSEERRRRQLARRFFCRACGTAPVRREGGECSPCAATRRRKAAAQRKAAQRRMLEGNLTRGDTAPCLVGCESCDRDLVWALGVARRPRLCSVCKAKRENDRRRDAA